MTQMSVSPPADPAQAPEPGLKGEAVRMSKEALPANLADGAYAPASILEPEESRPYALHWGINE